MVYSFRLNQMLASPRFTRQEANGIFHTDFGIIAEHKLCDKKKIWDTYMFLGF